MNEGSNDQIQEKDDTNNTITCCFRQLIPEANRPSPQKQAARIRNLNPVYGNVVGFQYLTFSNMVDTVNSEIIVILT